MNRCLDCHRRVATTCRGYCIRCKYHHECKICRQLFFIDLAPNRLCLDCFKMTLILSQVHRGDAYYPSPHREARVAFYTERAEQNLPLFTDLPACLQQPA